MQAQATSITVAATIALLLLGAGPAASDLVYNAADWPEINAPVLTGSGAPVPAANQAFSAEVAFTATSDLPGVVSAANNPQSGGVCPTTGSFGANGSCWWTCAYGLDGYPCAGPDDKRLCKTGKWGLSYDDGPSASTGKLLDSLKKHSLKATFCLIGSNVVRFPELTKRIHTEGHDLCVHTWSHSPLTTLTNDQIISEIKWTEKAIIAATGVKPTYFRPPYGDIDNRVRAVLAKMGYKVLLWFFDNSDYLSFGTSATITAAAVSKNMKDGVANAKNFPQGLIALSHPERGGDSGVTLAEEFFSLAKAASISLVPVSDCLGDASSTTSPNASTTTLPSTSSSTSKISSSTPTIGTTSAAARPPVGSYLTVLLAFAVLAVALRTVWQGNYAEKMD